MRSAARVAAFFAALGVIVAGLYAAHVLRAGWRWLAGETRWQWDGYSPRRRSAPYRAAARIAARARSLAARRRRPEGRHAIPPHPRPWQFPGIDAGSVPPPQAGPPWPDLPEPGFDVWAVPMRGEHLVSPAEMTCLDVKPPLWRPFVACAGEGRWVA